MGGAEARSFRTTNYNIKGTFKMAQESVDWQKKKTFRNYCEFYIANYIFKKKNLILRTELY